MLHQIELLLNNGVPLEKAGQWRGAIEIYERAFQTSVAQSDSRALTEAVLRIGHSYRQMGDTVLAAEYFELASVIAQLNDDKGQAGRALNGLAALHHVIGDLKAAEVLYDDARRMSDLAGDLLNTGHIDLNLGTLATIRGDRNRALEHYQSALSCYERVGHERGIAGVLNNLGMLHIDLLDLESAESALDQALQICVATGDVVTESIVQTNRTELFIVRGELDRARSSCDDAFEIASRVGDHRTKADALKFYGVIYREVKRPHLAEIHLRQAIAVASKYSNPLTEAESQRELALVLRAQDRNREALSALNRAHVLFDALRAERDQADVNKRLDQLQEDFLSLVRMWGESIEAKDRYTSGHCQRVADYACRIAEVAGFSEHEVVWFRMGAFLHDVGKTEVPAEILNKPGRLSDEERDIMERHTIIGDEMLAPVPFPWDIRPMVRHHHERWDGRGYPDRLAGDEIPMTARILRLADIFDALTTTRSYREPLSPQQALQIMESDEGSFDPRLLEIFRNLFPEFAEAVTRSRFAADNGESDHL